eukprot:CAMPEP_0202727276 /NCGR_PEP_ID=MMETSP1385-20130828/185038_1 /ASSEMBLY_ACC=CAM_ASM_000861 /TAXON_ID=933848 /ORGANISM="Elphidium margaritaceum" /LENGTH=707 /DNA_ID=CAMNT_0049393515 /DNA_START=975 /DNA_END=3099 /DNA_ORIENTATION=-
MERTDSTEQQGQGSQFNDSTKTPSKPNSTTTTTVDRAEQHSGQKRPLEDITNNAHPKKQKSGINNKKDIQSIVPMPIPSAQSQQSNDNTIGTQPTGLMHMPPVQPQPSNDNTKKTQPSGPTPETSTQQSLTIEQQMYNDIDSISSNNDNDEDDDDSNDEQDSERSRSRDKRHKQQQRLIRRSSANDLRGKYSRLKGKFAELSREQFINDNVTQTLRSENISFTAQIADLKATERRLANEIDELKKQMNHAHSRLQAAATDNNALADHAEHAELANRELQREQQENSKLQQNIKILKRHSENLQNQLDEFKQNPLVNQNSDDLQKRLTEQADKHKRVVETYQMQIDQYKQQMAQVRANDPNSAMMIDDQNQDDDIATVYPRWNIRVPQEPVRPGIDFRVSILSVRDGNKTYEIGLIPKSHVDEEWGEFANKLRIGKIDKQLNAETIMAKTVLAKDCLAANSDMQSVVDAHLFTTWYQPPNAHRFITFKVSGKNGAPTQTTTTATAGNALFEHHARLYEVDPDISQLTVVAKKNNVVGRIDAPMVPQHMMGDHTITLWLNGSINLNVGKTTVPIQDCIGGIVFSNKNIKITPTYVSSATEPMTIIAFGWNALCAVNNTNEQTEVNNYNAAVRHELVDVGLLPPQPQELNVIAEEQNGNDDDNALATSSNSTAPETAREVEVEVEAVAEAEAVANPDNNRHRSNFAITKQ